MAFDPCGTRKLEGEEILQRLADYLGIDKIRLQIALEVIVQQYTNKITLDKGSDI